MHASPRDVEQRDETIYSQYADTLGTQSVGMNHAMYVLLGIYILSTWVPITLLLTGSQLKHTLQLILFSL